MAGKKNAHALYDEPAENIMTIEIPQQLKIHYKDDFTLKPFITFTRGCLKRLPWRLRDYTAKQDRAFNHGEN